MKSIMKCKLPWNWLSQNEPKLDFLVALLTKVKSQICRVIEMSIQNSIQMLVLRIELEESVVPIWKSKSLQLIPGQLIGRWAEEIPIFVMFVDLLSFF